MDKCAKIDFDLSCQISSPHYFKSSFARSMAVDCMNQSKSLDSAFLGRPVTSETYINSSSNRESVWNQSSVNNRKCNDKTEMIGICNESKLLQKDCDYARVVSLKKSNKQNSQAIDADRLWRSKQDASKDAVEQHQKKAPDHQQSSQNAYTESDVLRLRKECQSLLEENRRLQAALDTRSQPVRGFQTIDSTMLQSQVDTLQWQLKHAESNRQMYRAVMEQVVRFLERAYKNLDLIKNKMDPRGNRNTPSPSRVPRSRSVHTVDASPSRVSPLPDSASLVPRAKSIAQIEVSPNYSTFRDFTWRRPRQPQLEPDEIPPDKLSQEAFRLLRTVQSLLNTREPDLAQRLCLGLESETLDNESNSSHRNSHTSFNTANDDETPTNQKRESIPLSTTSCNSLLKQSLETSSLHSVTFNNDSPLTSGLESAFAGGLSTTSPVFNSTKTRPQKCKTPSPPVPDNSYQPIQNPTFPPRSSPPVSSTEDESGFSSMNSFQEVGLPLVSPSPTPSYSINSNHSKQNSSYPETHFNRSANGENSTVVSNSFSMSNFQEVGLPIVEHLPNYSIRRRMTPNHRRWSSSPADALTQYTKQDASFHGKEEVLKVLWV